MTNFSKWLDTLVEEKGLDTETVIEKEGNSGLNIIPLGCLLNAIKGSSKLDQTNIKNTLVKIDFHNGDIMHFFRHLAGAITI